MPPRKKISSSSVASTTHEEPSNLAATNVRAQTFVNHQLPNGSARSWPHKTPSPEFMAKAGFYFFPTDRLKDRVKCFYCKKAQSTWKNVKDPTSHHLKKSSSCLFAQMHHYMTESNSNPGFDWASAGIFGDPLSEEAVKMRTESFANWPFDKLAAAKPTSDKMVAAGFVYYPQEEEDDLAICMYCGTSLEGWELDDDPMEEHRKRALERDCYFIRGFDGSVSSSSKRQSDQLLVSPVEKRSKLMTETSTIEEENEENEEIAGATKSDLLKDDEDQSIRRRPRRVRKVVKRLIDDGSSVDETQHDETFSLTGNSEHLNADEEYFESSNTRSNRLKSSSKHAPPTSPLKKSKILDSSMDKEDIFAANDKNIELPPIKLRSSPDKKPKRNSTLQDITNLRSPQKGQVQQVNDNNDEDEILLVTNSSDRSRSLMPSVSPAKSPAKSSPKSSLELPLADVLDQSHLKNSDDDVATIRPQSQNGDLLGGLNNSSSPLSSSISQLDPSPLASKSQGTNSPAISEQLSKRELRINRTNSRFFDSPKRSESPFLDKDYKGDDKIELPVSTAVDEDLPVDDDTPIGESTDHNIQISEPAPEAKFEPQQQLIAEDDNESFHSAEEETPDNFWQPTNTNKLFENLEDLDTARKFLAVLHDLPYELNDDIDGRVSCFINEMPDDEIEMTIEQWITHIASQGREHLNTVCTKMLDVFDDECSRALKRLENLPVRTP